MAAASDLGDGLGFAVLDGGLELGVVELVLVGVGLGEVGDGVVELGRTAEVGGQGDAVARAGVGPGQGPPAQPGGGSGSATASRSCTAGASAVLVPDKH